MTAHTMTLRLLTPTRGVRYNSEYGETRTIYWRGATPRDVLAARQGTSIDWGGAMVRYGDYEIASDSQAVMRE